ncbi:MAG: hypothetical protein KatS3mg110_3779 [Pirellulaceae bacterium]|nr:MAG: hypothetical protein KatS3mg110_3779 [Pirellulaceae bacterium]
MVRLRSVDMVLLVLCVVFGAAAVYDQSFCALIPIGAPNRAPECVVTDSSCHNQSGLCQNSEGETVQYASWKFVELAYNTCRPAPGSCYKCIVLNSKLPCKVKVYFMDTNCGGATVCEEAQEVNECETDLSGC